jgi:hypothetical protein
MPLVHHFAPQQLPTIYRSSRMNSFLEKTIAAIVD